MYEDLIKALRCEVTSNSGDCQSEECTPTCPHYGENTYTYDTLLTSSLSAIETLQRQLAEKQKIIDAYAVSARTIALYLKDFCDESLPYADMIADAARKVDAKLADVTAERDALLDFAIKADMDYMECDKMFIHVGYLKQRTGYYAYVVDAKQCGAYPMTFEQWLKRGVQKEATDNA